MADNNPIDPASSPADEHSAQDPRQTAGQDTSIQERLERNPASEQAQLDNGLDETMDASDPVSLTQPGHGSDPAPSSGYDADEEAQRTPS